MAVKSIFPLPEMDELRAAGSVPWLSNSCEEVNESCILIGSTSTCKTSLLFQAALTYASKGEQVIFICSQPFERKPLQVDGMIPPSSYVCQNIKMVYISDSRELIKYISRFHIMGNLPVAVLVDDLDFYVPHVTQDGDMEQNFAKLCALLQDSIGFLREKRGQPCHLWAAMTHVMLNQSVISLCCRFFNEVWCTTTDNLSTRTASIFKNWDRFLMYNTKAAIRIYYHRDVHSIFLDKVTQVSTADCSDTQEDITSDEEFTEVV